MTNAEIVLTRLGGFMPSSFIDDYKNDITTATFSDEISSKLAYQGAWADFVVTMTINAVNEYNSNVNYAKYITKENLVMLCLVSFLGTLRMYEPETNSYNIKKGKIYKYRENNEALNSSDKTISILLKYGVQFGELSSLVTEVVYAVRKFHEGDKMVVYFSSPVSRLLNLVYDKTRLQFLIA